MHAGNVCHHSLWGMCSPYHHLLSVYALVDTNFLEGAQQQTDHRPQTAALPLSLGAASRTNVHALVRISYTGATPRSWRLLMCKYTCL